MLTFHLYYTDFENVGDSMLIPIYAHLRYLVAFESDPKDASRVFGILKKFLESESKENFSVTRYDRFNFVEDPQKIEKTSVPLTLNKPAEDKLKSLLSEYPKIPSIGKKNNILNFIYLVGQYLATLHINLSNLSFKEPQEQPRYERISQNLRGIWGNAANSDELSAKYNGKSTEEAKSDLLNKIDKTIALFKKVFPPAIK